MLGREEAGGRRCATIAVPCRNAWDGDQKDRFLIEPKDQIAAEKRARAEGLDVLGFFHSHPDDEAFFSRTDLENGWPWYTNCVVSVRHGEYAGAACFRVREDRSAADAEPFELAD